MNDLHLLPDDPRITAYALGELADDERPAVEAAVRADPALQRTVADIRATAASLTAAFDAEAEADDARPVRPTRAADPYPVGGRKKLLQFPQVYFLVGGLAAAAFAVLAALRTPPVPAPVIEVAEAKTYVDMNVLVANREGGAGAGATPDQATARVAATLPPVAPGTTVALALPTASPTKDLTLLGQVQTAVTEPTNGPAAAASDSAVAPTTAPATADDRAVIHLSPFTISPSRLGLGTGRAAAGAAPVTTGAAPGGTLPDSAPAEPALAFTATLRSRLPAGVAVGANTESYSFTPDNGFVPVAQNAFSTFAVDTDTASYANIRRMLRAHQRPPRDAVRIEELLNYFPYRYAPPVAKSEAPFAASLEVAEAPWAPTHRLVRIGLKGREVATTERPAANLVFLLDVSGSMNAPNRLPLVKESLRLLVGKLRADDRVAIVTYAGQSGLALPSTPVARAAEILAALDRLAAGGATNGAMGIQLAYDIAKANRVDGGINRVILCTDGDFNVGVTSEGELVRLIRDKAASGVFLTVLGYGMGNLKDSTLEKLADHGNGHYGYIDSRREAEKLLVQQVNGTLVPIAKDVKIQVEFNPSQVASYRLIGYENRLLKKEDFADDNVDAGEIGAGHTVTALYEIIPTSVAARAGGAAVEPEERRYQVYAGVSSDTVLPGRVDPRSKEMLLVKVRYKKPDGTSSQRLDFPLVDGGARFAAASPDFKFAAAVAGFGMILRESPHKGTATMAGVAEWAEAGAAEDPGGYRSEFIELARNAEWVEQR